MEARPCCRYPWGSRSQQCRSYRAGAWALPSMGPLSAGDVDADSDHRGSRIETASQL